MHKESFKVSFNHLYGIYGLIDLLHKEGDYMRIKPWIKASRVPAQSFIAPALLLGQALHYTQTREFSWVVFLMIHLYGITMHLFIVYSNDVADYKTDQLNQTFTPFTGGSRVLVDQELSISSLIKAAIIMAVLTLLLGTVLAIIQAQLMILFLVIAGLFLLHAYSFSPIKLSYRGFGETLQMLGVGLVLPLVAYYAQGGTLNLYTIGLITIFLPSQLAMAMATSLPDEPSDRLSQKRTSAVLLGIPNALVMMIILFTLSLGLLTVFSPTLLPITWVFLLGTLLVVQGAFVCLKKMKINTFSMTLIVSLSILTNTLMVSLVSFFLFQ